jgi:hypothetical protein
VTADDECEAIIMSIISREWVSDGDSRTRERSVRLDSLIWLESAVQGSKISAVIRLGRSCVNEATAKEAVRPRTDASVPLKLQYLVIGFLQHGSISCQISFTALG